MSKIPISVLPLGQVGFRFEYEGKVIYIDPYLSNSVEEKEDSTIVRLKPIPLVPQSICDADYVLLTHDHRDHCDDDTLIPISEASPRCRFVGPYPVCELLAKVGIHKDRIVNTVDSHMQLTKNISITVVPSAHPEIRAMANSWACVGYVINFCGTKIYHAGDTSLKQMIIDHVLDAGDISVAMLPVNEINFMRNKQGIIGNMSVREAFFFAEKIQANVLVPTHWDMFAANQVFREEIEILYGKLKPDFELNFQPKVF